MGNMILFPAPTPTYTWCSEVLKPHLVWIPEHLADVQLRPLALKRREQQKRDCNSCAPIIPSFQKDEVARSSRRFPGLWFGGYHRHTLLYFHGNSTDLGDIYDELMVLTRFLECNCLAIEYPGYGVCSSILIDPKLINTWGNAAVRWLVELGVAPESIIPFGRSIGTGPAAVVAATMVKTGLQPGGLILHSPFLSIHKIVAHYSYFGTWVISNHWDTESCLSQLRPSTPLLIIHGVNDEVIPVTHGRQLLDSYAVHPSLKDGFFPADSPHNAYLIIEDLGIPIKSFLRIKSLSRNNHRKEIIIPRSDCVVPAAYRVARAPPRSLSQSVVPTVTSYPEDKKTEDLIASNTDTGHRGVCPVPKRPIPSYSTTSPGGRNMEILSAIKDFEDIPISRHPHPIVTMRDSHNP